MAAESGEGKDCLLYTSWDFIGRQSPAGEITLHIPRRGNRMARTVVLPVRFSAVTLQPPRDSRLPPVDLWAVHLHEENTDDPEPIEWMLLTTVPVHTFDCLLYTSSAVDGIAPRQRGARIETRLPAIWREKSAASPLGNEGRGLKPLCGSRHWPLPTRHRPSATRGAD